MLVYRRVYSIIIDPSGKDTSMNELTLTDSATRDSKESRTWFSRLRSRRGIPIITKNGNLEDFLQFGVYFRGTFLLHVVYSFGKVFVGKKKTAPISLCLLANSKVEWSSRSITVHPCGSTILHPHSTPIYSSIVQNKPFENTQDLWLGEPSSFNHALWWLIHHSIEVGVYISSKYPVIRFSKEGLGKKTSELRTMATVSIHTIMSTTSSCQPPIIQLLGSARVWERVTGEKQSRARNPVFLRVWWVAPGVAEVGPLFPQVRRSAAPSWSFLPCGFATVCDKTRWHGYAQESVIYIYIYIYIYAGTLLLCEIAAGGC